MQLTRVRICNMALLSIGTRSIAAMDENTPEAVFASQHYDLALEETLRAFPWNFAQARQSLAQKELPQEWRREYAYAYAYPAKCLHLHTLVRRDGGHTQDFTVAQHENRPIVLANLECPIAAYTILVEDTSQYDPLFARALSARLAVYLAPVILKGDSAAAQKAERAYSLVIAEAKTADAREGKPFNDPERHWNGGHRSPWENARFAAFSRN